MIIKLHRSGKSFKGVVDYLTHDAGKADTAHRLAWTHTVNLASTDHIPSAVHEMLWTCRAADQLKRAAGISTGGSKLERPVKHFTLSWHTSESPSREAMIDTTMRYLKHMGMEDRQAIFFSHGDTAHPHVHVVLNVVSPHDGRALKTGHEYRRTQAFALTYEREQGVVFCEERLKPEGQREPSPTRAMQQSQKNAEKKFDQEETAKLKLGYFERHDAKGMDGKEWEALKAYQREQREKHFAEGKEQFRAASKQAYREVRAEFRARWNAYYAAKRHGNAADFASMKKGLLEAQEKALDERRDAASEKLREQREQLYEQMLKQQKVDREELRDRQALGFRTYRMFDVIYPVPEPAPDRSPWKTERSTIEAPEKTQQFAQNVAHATSQSFERKETKPIGQEAPSVRSDAAVAREATRATREVTDSEAAKSHSDAAQKLRASWNQARRGRSRGD